ncbi:Uncharacterized protein TCM_023518 [Theobroma cacao]|uniref:Secreted protein n=1 Tax=Theobroma cacao TaxID=3641 RepID=A0A061EUC5_THECC|nr:Uncharacterized protein TCM_023518 [Theobroma cacao]
MICLSCTMVIYSWPHVWCTPSTQHHGHDAPNTVVHVPVIPSPCSCYYDSISPCSSHILHKAMREIDIISS